MQAITLLKPKLLGFSVGIGIPEQVNVCWNDNKLKYTVDSIKYLQQILMVNLWKF